MSLLQQAAQQRPQPGPQQQAPQQQAPNGPQRPQPRLAQQRRNRQQAGKQPPKDAQEGYQRFADQVGQFITSEEGVDMIAQAFESNMPIEEAIPMVVSKIFQGIFAQAQKAQKQLPPQIVIRAMLEVTQVVLQYAIDAGKITEEEAGGMAKDVTVNSGKELGIAVGDSLPPEVRNQYANMLNTMMEM